MIELKKVASSNIDMVGYEDRKLVVKFLNGNIYNYDNVSQEIYDDMMEAASIGSYFHRVIKTRVDNNDPKAIHCNRVFGDEKDRILSEMAFKLSEVLKEKLSNVALHDKKIVMQKITEMVLGE